MMMQPLTGGREVNRDVHVDVVLVTMAQNDTCTITMTRRIHCQQQRDKRTDSPDTYPLTQLLDL